MVKLEGENQFTVTWPTGRSQFTGDLAYDPLRRAYHLAMCGPIENERPRPRKQQPSGDGSKFGDDPPF